MSTAQRDTKIAKLETTAPGHDNNRNSQMSPNDNVLITNETGAKITHNMQYT